MLVDCFLYFWFRGLINLGGNTLREKLHELCTCGIQIEGAKERQHAFLAPLPGIGNTDPRAIYLVFGLTPILLLHISCVSCFVSMNAGKTLDTM